MEFIADLHLHSKYSRAVSQAMILPEMAKWALKKGLNIISPGDWTHPLWLREIKSQLEEASSGLYRLKSKEESPFFLLTSEIASIYKQGEKLRRIHSLIFAPSLDAVDKINKELLVRGCNLSSDGRPIVGLSVKNLLELVLAIDQKAMLIPCHIWTPHFGIYGSASGFDSLNEAFSDLDKYVFAIETGLSSDPAMNWQIEELQNRAILSFSDAHSLPKMGRECTVFTIRNDNLKSKISYNDIYSAIKRDPKSNLRISYTIEFYPEEGKYHFSGHRNCAVVKGPDDTEKDGDICPVCKRRLTEGVLYRVGQLSSKRLLDSTEEKESKSGIKWYTDKTKTQPPFVKLVPLIEIIAEALSSTVAAEKVRNQFDRLVGKFGSEISILLKAPVSEISSFSNERIAEGIAKVRKGTIVIKPGYDGEYGKVKIWNDEKKIEEEKVSSKTQLGLKF